MKKRTKILATIGPSSDSLEMIISLIKAGVNVFRLNFSHGTHEYHLQVLENIREAMEKTALIVGILQDISGPKVRIGDLDETFNLSSGDKLEFVQDKIVGSKVEENHYVLTLNQAEVLTKMKVNEAIYLCDGSIKAIVKEIGASVIAVVENEGILSSKKGVNFPHTKIGIDVITPKDREDIRWGVENGVDFMAISFVQTANDMLVARALIKEHGGDQQLFAKIEKFDAVENIDEILHVSDGLMVARGDLGIEVPFYEVPKLQKSLIKKANALSKPVITATQMMLSMTKNDSATRAEISDVANAVLDGTDAVMLSEESAVGHNPVLVVETMFKTISETEKIYPYGRFNRYENFDMMDAIDESVVRIAENLGIDALLTLTSSGQSAKKIARYRPSCPIHAVIHSKSIAQKLCIVWGVIPAYLVKKDELSLMLKEMVQSGLSRGIINKEKKYVLTEGYPVGAPGTTNSIRILSRLEIEYFETLETTVKKSKKIDKDCATLF